MRKMVIVFLIVINLRVISTSEVLGIYKYTSVCDSLYGKYNIDINTKSYKGWKRVCNNHKLFLYSNKNFINTVDENRICDCFTNHNKTRNVENLKDAK